MSRTAFDIEEIVLLHSSAPDGASSTALARLLPRPIEMLRPLQSRRTKLGNASENLVDNRLHLRRVFTEASEKLHKLPGSHRIMNSDGED